MTSPWPEDLISCVGEQLMLAVNELKPSACEQVCILVIECLPFFTVRQRSWLETSIKSLTPERICAYVNNFDRFCKLLEGRRVQVMSLTSGNAGTRDEPTSATSSSMGSNRLDALFLSSIEAFRSEGRFGLKELIHSINLDFRDGLSHGLFQDDWAACAEVMNNAYIVYVLFIHVCIHACVIFYLTVKYKMHSIYT